MMKSLIDYAHTYFLCLMRPGRMHDWLKHGIPLWEGEVLPPEPTLAQQLGLSWAFAVLQGISKLVLLNVILQALLSYQNENGFFFDLVDTQNGLIPYYVMLFSTSLDIIFFPVITLIITEFWVWVVGLFARWMHAEGESTEIAHQVTNVALSSNFFLAVPIIGVFLQKIAWLFLMYTGLRRNLGATRSLTIVILIAPTVLFLMAIALMVLIILSLAG